MDHHDEAYRWAERKQFVVHPATGALQMLSTEPSEAPGHAAVPVPAKTGLFDQCKDKHLLRLGVPEELIPLVRGIKTDAELEAVESQFPQEAYEALYMLASGYSLDEVFREMEKAGGGSPSRPEGLRGRATERGFQAPVLCHRRGEGSCRGPKCSARSVANLSASQAASACLDAGQRTGPRSRRRRYRQNRRRNAPCSLSGGGGLQQERGSHPFHDLHTQLGHGYPGEPAQALLG